MIICIDLFVVHIILTFTKVVGQQTHSITNTSDKSLTLASIDNISINNSLPANDNINDNNSKITSEGTQTTQNSSKKSSFPYWIPIALVF